VVGADITVRPVPQMDLYIISPQNDTTRLSTDLDGAADGSFREGVYRVESAAVAARAKPAKRENVERDIFAKYRSGVFTVFGAARGTGFLVDSTGLVVTNAHLVKGAEDVRVQIDSATKVYATPVVTDDDRDIAVLAINMSHCGSCAVLPLFDSTKSTAPA